MNTIRCDKWHETKPKARRIRTASRANTGKFASVACVCLCMFILISLSEKRMQILTGRRKADVTCDKDNKLREALGRGLSE